MDGGISKLEHIGEKDIEKGRPLSPVSIGFDHPGIPSSIRNGTQVSAGPTEGSIKSPSSPNKNYSVTFDDKVKDLEVEEEKKKNQHIIRFGFFPPRGVVGKLLTRLLTILIWFGVMWGVFGPLALPHPPPDTSHSSAGQLLCNSSEKEDAPVYCTFDLSAKLKNITEAHCPNKSFDDYAHVIDDEVVSTAAHSMYSWSRNSSMEPNCTPSALQTCTEECLCSSDHDEDHDIHGDILDPPPGHFFGLFMLTVVSAFFGFLAHAIRLPHLFGMMIGGILLNNLPVVGVASNISHSWSNVIRTCALVIVLIRGGLSMETSYRGITSVVVSAVAITAAAETTSRQEALRNLFPPIAALGILPCVCEAMTIFLISTWWTYDGNWAFGLMQGFLDAAISPSVLVPSLLNLEDHGYGVDEGIPTMLIVAAAFDDVICISLFGVFLAIIFNSGPLVATVVFSIFRGPIEVVLGLVFGIGCGLMLWYIPPKDFKEGAIIRNRLTLLLGLALFSFFAAQRMEFYNSPGFIGAGALGILILSFVASIGWKRGLCTKKIVDRTFFILWQFIEPLLFGLIGAEINFSAINPSLIGEALTLALSGLLMRCMSVFVITLFLKFNWKERLFIVIAWIPKATIQAAISGYPAIIAMNAGANIANCAVKKRLVQSVQTVAIFEIIIAAPVGALLIGLLGPRLLKKSGVDLREEERNEKTEEEIEEEQWLAEHPDSEVDMEHYHHHHHDDLFEIHDPIPEVIHWSETHCLGCVHRAYQWLKGRRTHGQYELNEIRVKKSRSVISGLNSPSLRSNPTPELSRQGRTPSPTTPTTADVHQLHAGLKPRLFSSSSRSPLTRSVSAPHTGSPLPSPARAAAGDGQGSGYRPQRLAFRFPNTDSTTSGGSDIAYLTRLPKSPSPEPEATLV